MGLTDLEPADFDALTFDRYGTLIDWETIRPIKRYPDVVGEAFAEEV